MTGSGWCAVCASCPCEAHAVDAATLDELMAEHTPTSGHHLWAVSSE